MAFLGRSLILLSLLAATAGAFLGFASGHRQSPLVLTWLRRLVAVFTGAIVAANLVMVYALVIHDFSVSYVAQVGSRALPLWVTVVSLWSSLEGSILFWGLVLGGFVFAAYRTVSARYPAYAPYAAAVWLACAAFFMFLLAGPAQPFRDVSPVPPDGPGPNPLLQNHILMAIHPPFLYLGYVGMTIPFGLACAALLKGRLGADFLRPLRTWLLLPWCFLTVAIMLGGWWAYEVLGWGGYWAWDPVENASFLPWLVVTAGLHSAILSERKGVLRGWTLTLVLASFLLTILGTFMTRSGVFNSVHSFTQSAIGPTILAFLAVALVGSVVLLALRIDALAPEGRLHSGLSRDVFFLVNNLLFVLFTFTVLIGTVFPLIVEATRGVQMSVGRPYFDRMAVPVGAMLLFVMGVGPALPWSKASPREAWAALRWPVLSGLACGALALVLGVRNGWTVVTCIFGGFTALVTFREMLMPALQRRATRKEGLFRSVTESLRRGGRRRFASYVVHASAVVVFVAIAVSSTQSKSTEVQLKRGESVSLEDYTLTFLGADQVTEPHRLSLVARIGVVKGGRSLGTLSPRMNQYERQREPIGTPDVRTGLFGDLYVSVMNIQAGATSVGILARLNPMVAWIWVAAILMALGGLAALIPTRGGA